MNEPERNPDPQAPGSLFRDVALLVLVGVALGVAHNGFMLAAGPGKGLAWVKTERKVVRLEDVETATPRAAAAEPSPPANPAPSFDRAKDATPKPARPASHVSRAPAPAATPDVAASTTAAPPAADVPAIPESREPLETGLAIVRKLFAANAAVFVDARGADEYAEGHIAGAMNIPFDEVFRDAKRLDRFEDRGLPVVTYCGGGDCDLSRNLAFSIIDTGRRRVVVYLGGLPEWQQAGLPVNKGEKP